MEHSYEEALELQIAALKATISQLTEYMEVPEKDCRCLTSPPCSDCVNHAYPRGLMKDAERGLKMVIHQHKGEIETKLIQILASNPEKVYQLTGDDADVRKYAAVIKTVGGNTQLIKRYDKLTLYASLSQMPSETNNVHIKLSVHTSIIIETES